ncbi:hypothetical protein GEV27_11975 [Aeromicrobium sp. S22]|uniref:hypothetical protein n=1 Tax=Aeromicrobium sp. S22 TaxID=2662029 RepID=UPI00129DCC67|nr:hypothetical protein [Aeromicrobium sp. S22]MRK02240.1 hypothetical protein [Aeromicrobium sp. S22]
MERREDPVDDEASWRRFTPGAPEREALLALSAELGLRLRPRLVPLSLGTTFEVEGIDADDTHLVQVVVNRGAFSSNQRNKVLADMFKLLWLRSTRFPQAEVCLVLSESTAEAFKPRAWTTLAADELGFHLFVVSETGTVTRLVREPV